jgi:hypothetical protein
LADKKITQLDNITGANLVAADEFVVVDISADETKSVNLGELKEALTSDGLTVGGSVSISGTTPTLLDVEGSGDVAMRIGTTGTGDADAFLLIDGGDTGESAVSFDTDGVQGASISMTGGTGGDFNISTALGSGRNIDLQPDSVLSVRVPTQTVGDDTVDIVEFFANGVPCGKIAAIGGDLSIGEGAVAIKFELTGDDRIIPVSLDTLA